MNRYNIEDSGTIELRFLIPSKAAGIIIGKGGENVKDIREKYEIKVNIPDSPGPERVLQISGRSASVYEALEIMLEKAKDCMPASEADIYTDRNRNKPRRLRSNRDEEGHGDEEPQPTGVDLRMLIHQSQAGSVIGRGGERIKELREQSDLRALKMYQNTCPSSTDRVAQIVGEVPKVMRCVKTIMDLLQTHQPRGSEQPYDARTYEESLALSYGGWLSKSAMKTVQEYGVQALALGGPGAGLSGNPAMANSALAAIHAARANMVSQGTQPPPSRFVGGAGRGGMQDVMAAAAANPMMMMSMMMPGGAASGPLADGNRRGMNIMGGMDRGASSTKTVQVSVPNSFMGAIMGRGGARIRSIREESGAEIRVYEPDKSGGDRIIDITGTPQQITYAQHLLKSCVLLYQDKNKCP
jgi:heterogeneous nuclear ribonucleoprotein K